MLIRVFRARPKRGMGDELAQLIEEVSIPFVDGQPGLLARHSGRGFGAMGDEIVMISVWESLDAMKNMTGENWESEVIPDEREAEGSRNAPSTTTNRSTEAAAVARSRRELHVHEQCDGQWQLREQHSCHGVGAGPWRAASCLHLRDELDRVGMHPPMRSSA